MATTTGIKGVQGDWTSVERPPSGTPAPRDQPYLPNHLGNFVETSQTYAIGAHVTAPAGTGIVVLVGVPDDDDANVFVREWRWINQTPGAPGHVLTVTYDNADELDAINSLRLVSALTVVNELGQDRTPL